MSYTIMKYLRISSEDIDFDGLNNYESNSITLQRALLDDFIAKTPEFENCEILEAVDDGRSGTNFQRPGIQRVLELVERGKIQCVIVKDLSRFGRNHLEVGGYLEKLFPAKGVRFISVTELYDSAQHIGETGGLSIQFRALIAMMYSQDLSDKVRSAKLTINKSGKTSAPYAFYGYSIDPDDRHKLIIDEPAAEIVRLIFNLREKGVTTPDIAKKLNDDGVPTASERKKEQGAKRDWQRNSKVRMWGTGFVTRILRDERYTGKHIYGKMKRVEFGRTTAKAVPKSEWIVVPDAFPAIITCEQFERVGSLMGVINEEKSDRPEVEGPLLSRKIFCGACGLALTCVQVGGEYVYRCFTPAVKSGLGCMHDDIPESVVIDTVLTVLRQQAQLADNVKSLNSLHGKSAFEEIRTLYGEVQRLKKLTAKANADKLDLWENWHTGNLSDEVYRQEGERLNGKIAEYSVQISEREKRIHSLEMESGQENVFVERYSKQVGISELTRDIVCEFIKAIHVYSPEHIEITLNYADEYARIRSA